MGRKVVIALGGNAIVRPGDDGSAPAQRVRVRDAATSIAHLIKAGYTVVVTHGNGPQVGNLLLQGEVAKDHVHPMPLDVCGAQSQGQIGYMLQQALGQEMRGLGLNRQVVTVVTQVLVDAADPAFEKPEKPVGPFYTAEEATVLMRSKGLAMKDDSGRGWRRVVPSPVPRAIVEVETIRMLIEAGCLVIAAGGGGIPVVRDADGTLTGVEAVIDKDLAGEVLAHQVGADLLMILTDVDGVALNWDTEEQTMLDTLTCRDARKYLAEGHFGSGSMGPKVAAGLGFVSAGGDAVITSLTMAQEALDGRAGTWILP